MDDNGTDSKQIAPIPIPPHFDQNDSHPRSIKKIKWSVNVQIQKKTHFILIHKIDMSNQNETVIRITRLKSKVY